MEPEIVERDRIILVGFSFFGDPFSEHGGWTEENEVGRLWNRFLAYWVENRDRVKHLRDNDLAYEVHVGGYQETDAKGYYEVFVGMAVTELEDVPVQLLVKVLPPTQYAVFTLLGEQIVSDWPRMVYREWLPAVGRESAHDYLIELYDRRFKGLENLAESRLDVYVPVRRVQSGRFSSLSKR
jgi:predicted transcriptional regulator YdeE